MKFTNSLSFAFVSAVMLVVVENLESFAFEFVLFFLLASLVQLGLKDNPWLSVLVAFPKAVANMKKRQDSAKNQQTTDEDSTAKTDYPELAITLAFEQEVEAIDEQGESEETVQTESEEVCDFWLQETEAESPQPALGSQDEIAADEGQAPDVEISEINEETVSEFAVLEPTLVESEVSVDIPETTEILKQPEILEKLRGLSTAKAWHRVFEELQEKGYEIPTKDKKASSQKARAKLLHNYGVRRGDLEAARNAALVFLSSQTRGQQAAS